MPAPVIELPVAETAAGRRIFKDEAEAVFNTAFEQLFTMLGAIPSGPQGERGPTGLQGERWIIGSPREFAEGLTCVPGNAIYRRYVAAGVVGLFRCLQATTTNNANFPATPVSNSSWELVFISVNGTQGAQGIQGIQGPTGTAGADGASAEVIEFATDVEALAYSIANPSAIVISMEGV